MKYCLLTFLLLSAWVVQAQQKEIRGQVTDAAGNAPLPGVNVTLKQQTGGAVTDAEGYYGVSVPDDDVTLVFSLLGYQTLEVAVKGRTEVNVALAQDVETLSDVVVIGYGQQKKVNLTGSVESIDGETLAKKPVLQTSMALQGMAPGVTVTQSSGRPGADGGTINIRGKTTWGNSSPLVLIDGVDGNINAVDPNDIENISILKDAAAAAIYGSRAAGGVILITTKRGKTGDIKLNYNAYAGWQRFTELPEYTDGYTYMTMLNLARENVGMTPIYSQEYLEEYQANKDTDPFNYPDTDWQDLMITEPGLQQHHNLTVSGGSEKLSSMASLSLTDQKAQIDNYDFKRYGVRVNNDLHISDEISFRLDLNGRTSVENSPFNSGSGGINSALYSINRGSPISAPLTPGGQYAANELGGGSTLADLYERGFKYEKRTSLKATAGFLLKPVKDLNINLLYTPQYTHYFMKEFEKPYDLFYPSNEEFAYQVPDFSSLNQQMTRSWENTVQLFANYSRSIGKHHLGIMGGFESFSYQTDVMEGYRRDFIFTDYPQLDAGSIANGVSNRGYANEWALLSYFGRLNYNFGGKYLFEANLRYDGSSRFASDYRWGVFPSFSAAWRLSEEGFMKNIGWLSDLKFRGSWGELGNQFVQGGLYPYISTVSINNQGYVLGGAPVGGAAITSMANELLTWETTETSNFGIDFGLFDNKLTGTFEYYVRNTRDILLRLETPAIIGLNSPNQNAGSVKNTGWDFRLGYRGKAGDFTYDLGFTLSDVKNEVTNLAGTGPYIAANTIRKVGVPLDALYGYKSLGLFQSQEEIEAHATQFGSYAPGDIKYQDITGDGIINAEDRIVLGDDFPRMTYSFNLTAGYKGFDLYVFLHGVGEREVYLEKNAVWAFYNGGKIQQWQMDYWTESNPDAAYPRLAYATNHNNFNVTDYWVYDASFLRVKTVQLGYTLPRQLFENNFVDKLRVYVTGNNLFTFHNMPEGWDPERPIGGAGYYPITRTFAFGVDLSF